MSGALIDPLGFTLEALVAGGALVEQAQGGAMAVLPAEAARDLGLAEEVRLGLDLDAPGVVPCGLGTPLLERLISQARARTPVAAVRLDLDGPRIAQARAVAERFVVRNGLADLVDATPGEATYVAAAIAWVAEADDRWEGTFTVVVEARDGGAPDEEFAALLDPARCLVRRSPSTATVPPSAVAWIARRAACTAGATVAEIRDSVARRQTRDHARIVEYFAALITEARRPRRATAPEAITAKLGQLVAERDAKVRDLATRYAVRVSLAPAAVVCATARTVNLRLHLRRRKAARDLVVRLPAGARALDRLACEGCPATTPRPALCDDRLHLLCEECLPTTQGRPRCPACAQAR
ncbi:MAG: hypothetical protein EXR72_05465 [Myxococcales bacterium]|nr:hypothetical protein [Myxococcales bacterium]